MADFEDRYPENVPGKYYVDTRCLDCAVCRDIAPNNFRSNPDGLYSYVYKQPTTPEEIEQCKEAFSTCPCDEIGADGNEFQWNELAYRLVHAAARGDIEGVKTAIADGCDVNAEWNRVTPLLAAVQAVYENEVGIEPYVTITGILLEHGADPNKTTGYFTKTPLCFAEGDRKQPVVDLLLGYGAKLAYSW